MARYIVRRLSAIPAAVLLLVGAIIPRAGADCVTTPKAGSAERKAIMDGLRVPVERQLHQRVIFVVSTLKVSGNWAFTISIPKQPNGKNVDYQKTIYKNEVKPGEAVGDAFSGEIIALLRRRGHAWKTVECRIGPSDVCWGGWDKKHGAPASIMGPK